jgi:geranylgeranyl diphosphate synthase type II
MQAPDLHGPDELKVVVEEALERLDLWPELHGQATSVRYSLEVGGKRVRPVIALAVGEALGVPAGQVLPAALAIELVHTFSLVHDDLPAMDDDHERRGRPSTWKKFGEGVGVLAGDALLAEAFRLAARYESSAVARELAEATLGMIGGQYLDTMVDGYDLAAVHRLKTGRLFYASVTMALWAAELPDAEQAPWRAFAEELGLLFQIVDDILDEDGYVREHGADGARRYADDAAERARARLEEIDAETPVLREIVDSLAVRTA